MSAKLTSTQGKTVVFLDQIALGGPTNMKCARRSMSIVNRSILGFVVKALLITLFTITTPGLAAGDEDESSNDEIISDLNNRIWKLEQIVERLLSRDRENQADELLETLLGEDAEIIDDATQELYIAVLHSPNLDVRSWHDWNKLDALGKLAFNARPAASLAILAALPNRGAFARTIAEDIGECMDKTKAEQGDKFDHQVAFSNVADRCLHKQLSLIHI